MPLSMSLSAPRLLGARLPACAQAHRVRHAWRPAFRSFGSRVEQARWPVLSSRPACARSLAHVPTLLCVQTPSAAANSRRSLSPAWSAARPRCAACRASLAQAAFELADIDARTAGTIATVLRPVLSVGILLMIVRIVLSWYPQARLPVPRLSQLWPWLEGGAYMHHPPAFLRSISR
jgi:hypothetical protein